MRNEELRTVGDFGFRISNFGFAAHASGTRNAFATTILQRRTPCGVGVSPARFHHRRRCAGGTPAPQKDLLVCTVHLVGGEDIRELFAQQAPRFVTEMAGGV